MSEECLYTPNGPCSECKTRKVKCSLMPLNPETGKTIRRLMSNDEVLEFRLRQAAEEEARAAEEEAHAAEEEARAEIRRGKRRADGSPDEGELEAPAVAPSPLVQLEGLGALSLDSGRSSAANTPDDNIASLPLPPSAHRSRETSGSSAGGASSNPILPAVDSSASQLFEPTHPPASSRRRNMSQPRTFHGRITLLENRLDVLEKWASQADGRLKL